MGARRLFCALMLGPELGGELARGASAALGLGGAERARGLAPVRPSDIHLTLAFAGALEPAAAERLAAELARALDGAPAPRLSIAGTDAFPRRGAERVLVARVLEPGGARLAELAARVARAAAEAGIELPDARGAKGAKGAGRPFAPHLTLARVRRDRRHRRGGVVVPERFFELDFGLPWQPSAAAWVESPGGGAPYRVLVEFPLATGAAGGAGGAGLD
jgi:2'-5' RNA ligase